MADTKISAMTAASSLAAADLIPAVQGGANKKMTGQLVFDFVADLLASGALADISFAASNSITVVVGGNSLTLNTAALSCVTPVDLQDAFGNRLYFDNGGIASGLFFAGEAAVSASAILDINGGNSLLLGGVEVILTSNAGSFVQAGSSLVLQSADGSILTGGSFQADGGIKDAGGIQVVGTQQGAVADASGGAIIDSQARTAINDLLAALRLHGLIAT